MLLQRGRAPPAQDGAVPRRVLPRHRLRAKKLVLFHRLLVQ